MSIQLSVRNPQGKTETKVAELLGNTLYTNGYLFRLFSLLPLTGGNREKKTYLSPAMATGKFSSATIVKAENLNCQL